MIAVETLNWLLNRRVLMNLQVNPGICGQMATSLVPRTTPAKARRFHQRVPGLRVSPLKGLTRLAEMLGVGGIWVKDEAERCELASFKVLGASYAIYQCMKARWQRADEDIDVAELTSPAAKEALGSLTFAAATDGNHGRGVAWVADKLGLRSVIYVPRDTSPARIQAIEERGAEVSVIDGTYDEAVERIRADAEANEWQVIADTAWDGYQEIPTWVIHGYTTMFSEVQEQLAGLGLVKPSHVFLQAGVGSFAASAVAFYKGLLGEDSPRFVIVEPSTAACIFESIRIGDGRPYKFDGDLGTIMAGLSCGRPNPVAWPVLRDCARVFIACPDPVAALGMRMYAVPLKGDPLIISGESGAVTLGVLAQIMQRSELAPLRDLLALDQDAQVLLVNTEGNTDPDYFRRVVWQGDHPAGGGISIKEVAT